MFPPIPTGSIVRSLTQRNIAYSVSEGTSLTSFRIYGPSTIDPGSIQGYEPVLSEAGTEMYITYTYVSAGTIQFICSSTSTTVIITDGSTVYNVIANRNGDYGNPDNFPQQQIVRVASMTAQLLRGVLNSTNTTNDEYNANPFGYWFFTAG